jgi:hypothetical protein
VRIHALIAFALLLLLLLLQCLRRQVQICCHNCRIDA